MGITVKTSLTILLVAMTASCIHGNAIGSRPREAVCRFIVNTCRIQLIPMISNIQSTGQMPDLEELCSVVSQARTCMGDCLEVITVGTQEAGLIDDLYDYVCGENHRDEVTVALEAQCLQNGTIVTAMSGATEDCNEEMTSHVDLELESTVCRFAQDMVTCFEGKVEERCGEEVVPFVHNIITITYRTVLSNRGITCFDQVTGAHSVMKRAVEYLKMIRKK